jgi:MFS family permease
VAWISLQAVSEKVVENYDVSVSTVSIVSLIYQGLYLVFTFPSNIAIDGYGSKTGMIIGNILTSFGMTIKIFINDSFWYCIGGQILAAIGQPFILNAPAKLASEWFPQKERIMAITMVVMFQALGVAGGFVVPSFFVREDDSRADFRYHVYLSLAVQAIAEVVVLVLSVLLLKDCPKNQVRTEDQLNKGQNFS